MSSPPLMAFYCHNPNIGNNALTEGVMLSINGMKDGANIVFNVPCEIALKHIRPPGWEAM